MSSFPRRISPTFLLGGNSVCLLECVSYMSVNARTQKREGGASDFLCGKKKKPWWVLGTELTSISPALPNISIQHSPTFYKLKHQSVTFFFNCIEGKLMWLKEVKRLLLDHPWFKCSNISFFLFFPLKSFSCLSNFSFTELIQFRATHRKGM